MIVVRWFLSRQTRIAQAENFAIRKAPLRLPAEGQILVRNERIAATPKGRRRTNRHCQIAMPGKSVRSQGESLSRKLCWLSFSRSEMTYQAKPGAGRALQAGASSPASVAGAALSERGVVGIAV